jgi:hypothetical protein
MPLPLLTGDRRLDRKQHLVIPGGGVQSFGGADEAGVGLFERLPNFGGGATVLAAEPILPRDDDPGSLPGLTSVDGFPQSPLTPRLRAGHVLFDNLGGELDAGGRGPSVNVAPLFLNRDRLLPCAALPQVRDKWASVAFHRSPSLTRLSDSDRS